MHLLIASVLLFAACQVVHYLWVLVQSIIEHFVLRAYQRQMHPGRWQLFLACEDRWTNFPFSDQEKGTVVFISVVGVTIYSLLLIALVYWVGHILQVPFLHG